MLRILFSFGLAMLATLGAAQTLDTSLRPESRPAQEPVVVASARADTAPVRPVVRPNKPVKKRDVSPEEILQVTSNAGFKRWTKGFRKRALGAGISAAVFDRAFKTTGYLPKVIERDRNQSEFTKTIWDYLDSAVSEKRLTNGKAALETHGETLAAIEAKYGVEKEVVVAVWGVESAYGEFRGDTPIISALATLAYDGRRGKFFEGQLIAALKILQSGDTDAGGMLGSWAGAMGHTQFIPTSYLDYAVDFTGDGKRDIWGDDPSDALASTASYLKGFGWKTGQPWGVEVKLPEGFDYALASRKVKK